MIDSNETVREEVLPEWPERPVILALLGLATGIVINSIGGDWFSSTASASKLAELVFISVSAGLIAFTIERRWWLASLGFGLAMGAAAAGVVWWNGTPEGWSGGDGWRLVSLFLAIAIAAPLFQAARDEGRLCFPYRSVHDHAWTNVVLWVACWVFVGIAIALAFLLSGLFGLIKLNFLRDLMRESWFWHALVGLAFGSALGLLREHTQVVRLLQRVVATVLAVLAPVLAAGLIVFVLALPFTGLTPLWQAGSATAILLACIVGSLILANAVFGNAPEEERRTPLLRIGAMGLALVMLPMGTIAAIAIGLRIAQYGFTPERLWALTFVILACAYGLAYLVSLIRGRMEWAGRARPANLNLAFGVCGVALLLATPLVSFNAIATRDQVARLESGRIAPDKFDWRALAFSFGEPGRVALKKLQASANSAIRARAAQVGKATNRWDVAVDQPLPADIVKQIRVLPAGVKLPDGLIDYLGRERCGVERNGGCTVLIIDPASVMVLRDNCFGAGAWECRNADHVVLKDGKWSEQYAAPASPAPQDAKVRADAQRKAYAAGQLQVREVTRRQLFVGEKPLGPAFE